MSPAGMSPLLWVMLGGGLGSGARYLVSTWVMARFGSGMPWGTLLVNVLGSLVLGVFAQLAASGKGPSTELRLFFTTGMMGGFTTYSTFNQETLGQLGSGQLSGALLNIGLTVGLCLGAGALGAAFCRLATG